MLNKETAISAILAPKKIAGVVSFIPKGKKISVIFTLKTDIFNFMHSLDWSPNYRGNLYIIVMP